MGEFVGPADGGAAGIVLIKWAEEAARIDVADGLGIDEGGVEAHGVSGAEGAHFDLADLKSERDFAGLVGAEDKRGTIDFKPVDDDLDLAAAG